jgi:hypothetical protein
MNAVVKPASSTTPAADELAAHRAGMLDLEQEAAALRARLEQPQGILTTAQADADELAALKHRLRRAISDGLINAGTQTDTEELEADIADRQLQAQSQVIRVEAARDAVQQIHEQLGEIDRKRSAELARRSHLQHAVLRERLVDLVGEYSAAIDRYCAAYAKLVALGTAADYIGFQHGVRTGVRPPLMAPLAEGLERRVRLPVPHNLDAYAAVGRTRDVSEKASVLMNAVLDEIGVERAGGGPQA